MKKYLNQFTLFRDPVYWAKTAVSTWPRFGFITLFLVLFTKNIIERSSEVGPRWFDTLLLVSIPLMLLYALRRLYLELPDNDSSTVK